MPIGPFDPIPAKINGRPNVVRVEHINDMRAALTGVQDAYDVAVADGFVGSRADFIFSLKSTEPGPEGPEGPAGSAVDIIGVVDGGAPDSTYGGTTTIDGGSV